MGRTNLEIIKDKLCRGFEKYISGMDAERLYRFQQVLEDTDLLSLLSEECGQLQYPEETLTCRKCEKLYGNCDSERLPAPEGSEFDSQLEECRTRFLRYCGEREDGEEQESTDYGTLAIGMIREISSRDCLEKIYHYILPKYRRDQRDTPEG